MEEKIIEARFLKNKLARYILIFGCALIALGIVLSFFKYSYEYSIHEKIYVNSYGVFHEVGTDLPYPLFFLNCLILVDTWYIFALCIDIGILGVLLSRFLIWEMSKCSLTVTNRRVTGKASFGKAVDLPLNQISAVGLGIFSRITVATSSGRIHFWYIENREEVHSALTEIIGKIQVEDVYSQNNSKATQNTADELKQFKELLDSGVITQEEFDAKKKQLLGL